jgi:transcriptional regulator with XRE-family HTH domain
MGRPTKIHHGKQPHRLHYIIEWAERRGRKQADIVRGLDVDKSTVSRWFDGTIPSDTHLIALADYLEAGEPAALFRHPDDDWLARFFRERSQDEASRMRAMLEAAFPRKHHSA